MMDLLSRPQNNSRLLFDSADDEVVLPNELTTEELEGNSTEEESTDNEGEYVPIASRRAKFSKIIRKFMKSSDTSMTFSTDLTTFERKLVHRIAHQWHIDHESYGEGNERYIVVSKPDNRKSKNLK